MQPGEINYVRVFHENLSRYKEHNRGKRIEVAASLTLARSLYPEIESTGFSTVLRTEITRL